MAGPRRATPDAWFSCPASRARARVQLFCFPYAGAGASIYRDWPEALAPDVEVWFAHLPGRERRIAEPSLTSIDAIAGAASDALRGCLFRPYALFGHSMGALIAFEVCRSLRSVTVPTPACLMASGYRAPHLPNPREPIHDLTATEFRRKLAELAGTPPSVIANEELMELLLPTLRADFMVVDNYRHHPGPPLAASLRVYGGRADPEVPTAALEAWRQHTTGDFALTLFEGGHFFLDGARGALLRQVAADLQSLAAGC
jgi:medium-chain acyl-[acyl-carrier-protein] hydrolase